MKGNSPPSASPALSRNKHRENPIRRAESCRRQVKRAWLTVDEIDASKLVNALCSDSDGGGQSGMMYCSRYLRMPLMSECNLEHSVIMRS